MDAAKLMATLDKIESGLGEQITKATAEIQSLGKVSKDTETALENLGKKQLEQAERLASLEQTKSVRKDAETPDQSWGGLMVKDAKWKGWVDGDANKVRFELKPPKLKNTIIGDATIGGVEVVVPDRLAKVIPGPFRILLLEQYLNATDTVSNAIEYTREVSFTNNAAETPEGAAKPQTDIVFQLVNQPVSTVAHWIKISRQLSKDAPALVAYVNTRMRYGVDKRVEDQLVAGNGVGSNIWGLLKTGNYVDQGYTAASLGTVNPVFKLIRRVMADLAVANYPADIVIMNPSDWADAELTVSTLGTYIIGQPQANAEPMLWGLRVIPTNAMPVGQFIVMSHLAATVYNREGVIIEMSESDVDNFTKNLITIRAERRLMLAVEIPAAIRGGSLHPA